MRVSTAMSTRHPWRIVWALAVTEIISYGTLYYAFSVLLVPMETELGWSRSTLVGAFSVGMLTAGLAAWPAGLLIDRFGGRRLMGIGSLAAGALLAVLASVHSVVTFYLVWAALGVAMSAILYEPAFAVIYQNFREDGRKAVTALTLAAGFSSTIFWPLTQVFVDGLGWRGTLVALALLNLLVCFPLHALVLPPTRGASPPRSKHPAPAARGSRLLASRTFWLLAMAFTANMLAFSALSVHLLPLLTERGLPTALAVTLAALVGPMQVAGRVVEYALGKHVSIVRSGMVALVLLPLAMLLLLFAGASPWLVGAALLLYGASNGVMTIVRAAVPAELFERSRYGAISGALQTPVVIVRAAAPIVASWLWTPAQGYALLLWALAASSALAAVSFRAAIPAGSRRV